MLVSSEAWKHLGEDRSLEYEKLGCGGEAVTSYLLWGQPEVRDAIGEDRGVVEGALRVIEHEQNAYHQEVHLYSRGKPSDTW
jgi:hypothetical protein